ncbi:MAG: hypothetical protein LBR30_02905 [Clostridioides sp.]|jgi:hypothetical protein|nr:hypothetical protein [Clostridioides sp.]
MNLQTIKDIIDLFISVVDVIKIVSQFISKIALATNKDDNDDQSEDR